MSSSPSKQVTQADPTLEAAKKSSRISVAETTTRSPRIISPKGSPVPSVQGDIASIEVENSGAESSNDTRSPDTVVRALSPDFRTGQPAYSEEKEVYPESEALNLPQASSTLGVSPNLSTQALRSPRSSLNAPSVLTGPSSDSIPKRGSYQGLRASLLNEPSCFLSATTSSRSSMASLKAELGPEEEANDNMVMAAAQQAKLNIPSLVDHNRNTGSSSRHSFGNSRNSRPKPSRVLGEDLQALATEQGGIPLCALASPTLNSPPRSAPSRIPSASQGFVPMPETVRENELSPNGTPVQHPLRGNPSLGKTEPLYRAATLPASARRIRRPTFLPPPIDPSPGRRFERQSIISTPYPYSGSMAGRQRDSPRERMKAGVAQRRLTGNADLETLAIIVRDPRGLQARIGKIDVRKIRSTPPQEHKPSNHDFFDDASLCLSILQEYRRLKGWPRYIFNARGLIRAKVLCRSSFSDSPAEIEEVVQPPVPETLDPATDPMHALSAAEEGHGSFAARAPVPTLVSRESLIATARSHLERTLCTLLRRPGAGAARTTCVSNLRSLLDAQRSRPVDAPPIVGDEEDPTNAAAHSLVAVEVIESWNARSIGAAVVTVLLLSVLAALLWTLFGVGGAAQEVDVNVNLPSHGHGRADTALKMGQGWKAAGARVQAGTTLGILVLLLGWSSVGAWVGGSLLLG